MKRTKLKIAFEFECDKEHEPFIIDHVTHKVLEFLTRHTEKATLTRVDVNTEANERTGDQQ